MSIGQAIEDLARLVSWKEGCEDAWSKVLLMTLKRRKFYDRARLQLDVLNIRMQPLDR